MRPAGFVDNKQNFQRRTFTFCVDGLTSVIASVMGSSGITAFVESASGIRAGGRTGLTALTVALYFAATLFFNPLICERLPPVCKDILQGKIGPFLFRSGCQPTFHQEAHCSAHNM